MGRKCAGIKLERLLDDGEVGDDVAGMEPSISSLGWLLAGNSIGAGAGAGGVIGMEEGSYISCTPLPMKEGVFSSPAAAPAAAAISGLTSPPSTSARRPVWSPAGYLLAVSLTVQSPGWLPWGEFAWASEPCISKRVLSKPVPSSPFRKSCRILPLNSSLFLSISAAAASARRAFRRRWTR